MESIEKIWNNAKKKTTSYKEQKTEQVNRYLERIKDIPADEIVYIDETGINTCIYREYGYAPQKDKKYMQKFPAGNFNEPILFQEKWEIK